MRKFNFKNVVLFPNFRFSDFQPDFSYKSSKFSIVFMARVDREKGLAIVFDIAERIEQKYGLQAKERPCFAIMVQRFRTGSSTG